MEATQDTSSPPLHLAPVYLPDVDEEMEIARIWGVKYKFDQDDSCEKVYGIAWKNTKVSMNCWMEEKWLAPNSPADLEKKYSLDVASRKILFQKKQTNSAAAGGGGDAAGKLYWIHWKGNDGGEPWCEWWEEDKVSIFAPELTSQMETAPDFPVGKAASLDEEMDLDELNLELLLCDNMCPTTILRWVEGILPIKEESDANVNALSE